MAKSNEKLDKWPTVYEFNEKVDSRKIIAEAILQGVLERRSKYCSTYSFEHEDVPKHRRGHLK